MWSRLLCSWLVLVTLSGVTQAGRPDPHGLAPIAALMSFDGVEISEPAWTPCGMENAFYYPWTKAVVLCTELKALPDGVIRFFLAHEYAHAVIVQRGLVFSRGMHEQAADELALVMLGVSGRYADIESAAAYFNLQPQWDLKSSNHPSNGRRAHKFYCIAQEAKGNHTDFCGNYWTDMVRTWVVLLNMG